MIRLFRPAWDSENEKRAVRAVEKMTDRVQLLRVVKEARCRQARIAAINKIIGHDQELQDLLAKIAKNANRKHVRINPIVKRNDQDLLANIAINAKDKEFCMKAVEKLTDQKALAKVAKSSKYSEVRLAAVYKITDPSVLVDIAKCDRESEVRVAAEQRLADISV